MCGVTFSAARGVFAAGSRKDDVLVNDRAAFLWVHNSRRADVRNKPLPPMVPPSVAVALVSSKMVSHLDKDAVMHLTTSPMTLSKESTSCAYNSSQTL